MINVPLTPLQRAILDQKIAILILEDGDECAELLAGVAASMEIVLRALDGKKSKTLQADFYVTLDLLKTNAMRRDRAKFVVRGLDSCMRLAPTLRKTSIDKAWKAIQP